MSVLLARHGETDDNVEPLRFQGHRDTPLNDTGRAQAAALADRLAGRPGQGQATIAALWSSDLSRAQETARIVGERLGLTARLDPRLREGNRGRWEGHLFSEIEQSEPELYARWRQGGAEWRFPEGESLAEHQLRVKAAVDEIRVTGPLPALAVCHGGSIRVMLALTDAAGLDAFHRFSVPNTAVVSV